MDQLSTLTWMVLLAVPGGLGLLLVVLDRLERNLVAPIQRGERIRRILDSASADEVEVEVTRILAPVVPQARPPMPSA